MQLSISHVRRLFWRFSLLATGSAGALIRLTGDWFLQVRLLPAQRPVPDSVLPVFGFHAGAATATTVAGCQTLRAMPQRAAEMPPRDVLQQHASSPIASIWLFPSRGWTFSCRFSLPFEFFVTGHVCSIPRLLQASRSQADSNVPLHHCRGAVFDPRAEESDRLQAIGLPVFESTS